MGIYITAALLAALLIFLAVIIIRALRFLPPVSVPVTPQAVAVDREKVVADMADMVRCRTVSYRD